jgi:hypothetical protein
MADALKIVVSAVPKLGEAVGLYQIVLNRLMDELDVAGWGFGYLRQTFG